MSDFFKMYRKRGFGLAIEILLGFKDNEAIESDFFQALKDNDSYLNEFYRSKGDLLTNNLIGYKLDANYNKIIFLTEKGLALHEKLKEIDRILGV